MYFCRAELSWRERNELKRRVPRAPRELMQTGSRDTHPNRETMHSGILKERDIIHICIHRDMIHIYTRICNTPAPYKETWCTYMMHKGHCTGSHRRDTHAHTKRQFTATHSKCPELINSCISLYHVSCRIQACTMNSCVCMSVLSLLVQATVYQVSSCTSANHVYVCLCFMSPCLCTCIMSPCLCMCNMSPCLCMCIMSPWVYVYHVCV